MLYMNDYDIQYAAQRLRQVNDEGSRAVLAHAIQLLYDLVALANEVSDGWAYWKAPCRSAAKLQELIQSGLPSNQNNFDPPIKTQAELRKAVSPIKAFMTREAHQLQGKTLNFPC